MEEIGFEIPYQLKGQQLLVKQSFVNGCLAELRTQVVDELQNCVFLRVVRLGPELAKDKSSGVSPGSLVALHETSVGEPLKLRGDSGDTIPHYIIKFSDVVGVVEF